MDFDDLNPPMAENKGDVVFGCIVWALVIGGIVALIRWLT